MDESATLPPKSLSKSSSKFVWAIVLSCVFTAFVVGSALYFWQQSIIASLQSELNREKQQVQQLKQQAYEKEEDSRQKTMTTQANKPIVTFFFKDSFRDSDRIALEKELKSLPGVKTIHFTSKEAAYERYMQSFSDDSFMQSIVSPDILPASMEVYASEPTPEFQEKILSIVEGKNYIEDVVRTFPQ